MRIQNSPNVPTNRVRKALKHRNTQLHNKINTRESVKKIKSIALLHEALWKEILCVTDAPDQDGCDCAFSLQSTFLLERRADIYDLENGEPAKVILWRDGAETRDSEKYNHFVAFDLVNLKAAIGLMRKWMEGVSPEKLEHYIKTRPSLFPEYDFD